MTKGPKTEAGRAFASRVAAEWSGNERAARAAARHAIFADILEPAGDWVSSLCGPKGSRLGHYPYRTTALDRIEASGYDTRVVGAVADKLTWEDGVIADYWAAAAADYEARYDTRPRHTCMVPPDKADFGEDVAKRILDDCGVSVATLPDTAKFPNH